MSEFLPYAHKASSMGAFVYFHSEEVANIHRARQAVDNPRAIEDHRPWPNQPDQLQRWSQNRCIEKYPGTSILHCPKMYQDIKTGQSRGKTIILSIGVPTPFLTTSQTKPLPRTPRTCSLADPPTQPLDDAILDGVELDQESERTQGFTGFLQAFYAKFAGASHSIYGSLPQVYLGAPGGPNAAWANVMSAVDEGE
ncbi:hypothetical protein BC939DRAFT_490685 [Gamsiella multidivaricata]|uniref:uncharacterized protein n=1 Tax=Gamsiella multidivaricata TaxID=101098 RepID=UPI0022200448|nr:uncharacterized protein BC939DRAFT_490685 [Gamsiella multidivaricata]KAI7828751.1 hypothetical protein BC939DRAFT_490685 [Gamsiella multidivaricata]